MDAKKSLTEIEQEAAFKELREHIPQPWGMVLSSLATNSTQCSWTTIVAFASAGWVGNSLAANSAPICAVFVGVFIVVSALWLAARGEITHATNSAIGNDTPPQS